jgi:predicted nucleic acid-binding protein
MTGTCFVDTNLLVYARDTSEASKQGLAEAWLAALWRLRRGRLSYQVLHEYCVIVTRKLRPGIPVQDARDDVRALMSWRPVSADGVMLEGAWAVQDRFGLSWWDALVVSAAQIAGADYLLTEDLQAGQDLEGVLVVDPFQTEPEKLL